MLYYEVFSKERRLTEHLLLARIVENSQRNLNDRLGRAYLDLSRIGMFGEQAEKREIIVDEKKINMAAK